MIFRRDLDDRLPQWKALWRLVGLMVAVSTALVGCQRPAQRLPAAPIFSMPQALEPRQIVQLTPPVPASLLFQPFDGPEVIYFESGSAELDTQARAVLDRQAEWMVRNPTVTAVLRGHADLLGDRARQFALGEMRAEAMRRYLVTRGVAPNRLMVTSFGKQRPVSTARDELSQRRNRRGETMFSNAAGK